MRPLPIAILGHLIFAMSISQVAYAVTSSITYDIKTIKRFSTPSMNGHVSIQVLALKTARTLSNPTLIAINKHLASSAIRFTENAKDCLSSNPGDMWHYNLRFEKMTQTGEYVSFIFHKDRICGGTPDFDKEVRTYAKKNGAFIPSNQLFRRVFPHARDLNAGYSAELIALDEQMSQRLFEDSAANLKDFDTSCESYLARTSYRMWLEPDKAVFYPEFRQVHSDCQKEYVIVLSKH